MVGDDRMTGEVSRLVSQLPPAVQALTGVDLSKVSLSICVSVCLSIRHTLLCLLRSIATLRDHFVQHLTVCLSVCVCPVVTLSW